jgi:hypothetical protein
VAAASLEIEQRYALSSSTAARRAGTAASGAGSSNVGVSWVNWWIRRLVSRASFGKNGLSTSRTDRRRKAATGAIRRGERFHPDGGWPAGAKGVTLTGVP